ncbi:MAG: hypothetical protein WBJ75_00215, partial [Pseudohongiellaceae bacterium]
MQLSEPMLRTRLQIPFYISLLLLIACSPAEQAPPAPESVSTAPAAAQVTPAAETEEALVARARGIHERVITLDTHADINTVNFMEDNNYTADLDTQ